MRDFSVGFRQLKQCVRSLLAWQNQVLSWNYHSIQSSRNRNAGADCQHDGGPENPANSGSDAPPSQPIPETFAGAEDYINSFRPVLLLELQSIIRQGIEENGAMETMDVYKVTEVHVYETRRVLYSDRRVWENRISTMDVCS